MNLFTGVIYPDEQYSCSCGKYVGHDDEWKCTQCGQPIIITGNVGGNSLTYYRINPLELEPGMFLLVGHKFYQILRVYSPVDENRMYVNLRRYGQYVVNLNHCAIISI